MVLLEAQWGAGTFAPRDYMESLDFTHIYQVDTTPNPPLQTQDLPPPSSSKKYLNF